MIDIKEDYKVIDKGADFILAQLHQLGQGIEITTGIHSKDFDKKQTSRKKRTKNNTSVGEYAAMNEFGTKKIPARPFMLKTMDRTMDLFLRQTMAGMRSIYNGSLTMDGLVNRQKNRTRRFMKDTIKQWTNPPNAQMTAMRKQSQGMKTTPLRETDTLYRNITSESKDLGTGLPQDFLRLATLAEGRLKKRSGIF